jgi:osmotically-inducible protein OsmY
MTHHTHHQHQRGSMNWDEDDERGHRGYPGDQQRSGGRGSWVQDRGDYGGWASGEGQGEFAGDGYSAQGQFSNQRVAQYGDQGYGEEYGRQGIGWQNRQSGQHHTHSHEGYGAGQSDWQQDAGGYWGQGAGGGQGIGGSDAWRQERSGDWGVQGHRGPGQNWEGRGGGTGYSAAGSWMAGPHSGRGPQGYQRSDARIEEDVCEHLTHHGMLDATGIQVQVENGEVTLTGTVESRQAKRLAEDILDAISGVRDVHNQLRVQRDQGQDHQNPFMAQTQMGQADGQGSNGQSQSRGRSQRDETKAGTSNS